MRVNTRTGPADVPVAVAPWWQAGLVLVIALLAQIELLHYATFRGAEPSLVLVAVVWYAIRTDARRAVLFGLIAGLCEDVFSAQTGAAWTISTTITALAVSLLSRSFFADSIAAIAVVAAIATMLRRMIFWIVMALQGYPPGYAGTHLHRTLWEALFNAIVAAVVLAAARVIENRRTR